MSTPRINAAMVAAHANQRVLLMCQVLQAHGGQAKVLCTDRAEVTVHVAPGVEPLVLHAMYELLCRVDHGGALHEESRLALNPEFDLDGMNDVIKLAQTPELKPLFTHA